MNKNKSEAVDVKRKISIQFQKEINARGITKTSLAESMKTSRAQVNRLLDPVNTSVTLHSLMKAAEVVNKKIKLEMI